MERPDLDAIEKTIRRQRGDFWDEIRLAISYCRELEAENRRFKQRYVEHAFEGSGDSCESCGMGRNYLQHILAASRRKEAQQP